VVTSATTPHYSRLASSASHKNKIYLFLFQKKLGGEKKGKKRKGKILIFVGSLKKFQNDFLKTSFIAYTIQKSFLHFFANCGAATVVA
jgi:hypothetical protein